MVDLFYTMNKELENRGEDRVEKDSIFKYSLERGFGELIWNLCPMCGGTAIKTTLWEDGSVERGECLICKRTREIMELEEALQGPTEDR
jgi:hypothetical protein